MEKYKVGIYMRISTEDGELQQESMSIANQRFILTEYVHDHGWSVSMEYVDDGWTGTNFDRPGFQQLVKDIKAKAIDCVIVKDLSRLGREYTMTGYYIETFFPENDVRFLSITEGLDSEGPSNDIVAFLNVCNGLYPKQVSQKVRDVKKANARKGLYMQGRVAYGLKKSVQDKHILELDPVTNPIVVRILTMLYNGTSARTIAEILTAEGIPSPMGYYYSTSGKACPPGFVDAWNGATVSQMARNPIYKGVLVQHTRENISYKSKKRRLVPKDQQIVVEGVVPPTVDPIFYDDLQRRLNDKKVYRKPRSQAQLSIFAGLVRCADCGGNMRGSVRGRNNKMSYRCTNYQLYGAKVCTSHNIREEILEEIVLRDIHSYGRMASCNREALAQKVCEAIQNGPKKQMDTIQSTLSQTQRRLAQVSKMIKQLYEDRATEVIPEPVFLLMMDDYQKEVEVLRDKVEQYKKTLADLQSQRVDVSRWLDLVESYLRIEHLDRQLARNLIDKIIISQENEAEQRVTIYYNFVGCLDSNDSLQRKTA